ncbi:hypothetical protein GUJ93_ZPchr0001g31983 [Zizania palustris]|uniref:Auxin-responsive protein n=1 Tax=Zizania palustris TaxID=103762 RepID=A0A8J5RXL2_ZIZPA|nr:hypothetical protein GUJ93_ZPchr0001g31983 [Zizania palustris]
MEEGSKKREGLPPQLLDLIPDEKEWKRREALCQGRSRNTGFESEEDKKLDLKLGLPGLIEEDKAATSRDYRIQEESTSLSLGFLPKHSKITTTTTGAKRGFIDTVETKREGYNDQTQPARAGCGKELAVEEMIAAVSERKKGCCPPPPHGAPAIPERNSGNRPQTQRRGAATPVVGWPPIRSFRRNLASSSSSKQFPEPRNVESNAKEALTCKKNPLVKINMDGIPIGRKIDLAAYDSYDGLSSAVKELFHNFLQAQKEIASVESAQGADEKIFYQLLDGSGEYTLVYEDSEGDRMLVGDVPWNVFVSTAKRLRVLRSSELSHTVIGATARV